MPVLTIAGFAGLAVTCLLAFEEPNAVLLGASAAALFAAPLAVGVHLGFTRQLTTAEKRTWLGALHGRRAMWAWSAYLTSSDRAAPREILRKGRRTLRERTMADSRQLESQRAHDGLELRQAFSEGLRLDSVITTPPFPAATKYLSPSTHP